MPRILIVEDHAFFSDALALVLGRRLSEVGRGPAEFRRALMVSEGLDLAANAGPFDLAVVDLMLPDGDGAEVVRAIKASGAETPVAVLRSSHDLSRFLEADEAINKSVGLQEVVSRLERLLADGDRTPA